MEAAKERKSSIWEEESAQTNSHTDWKHSDLHWAGFGYETTGIMRELKYSYHAMHNFGKHLLDRHAAGPSTYLISQHAISVLKHCCHSAYSALLYSTMYSPPSATKESVVDESPPKPGYQNACMQCEPPIIT